jgi:two-component system, OmpR family, response regulator
MLESVQTSATVSRPRTFGDFGTVGHILVVDSDPAARRTVTNYFRDNDMPANGASGRQELTLRLASGTPALIILDLSLGRDDGLHLLKEIRRTSDVPVIITTGHRMDEVDRVVGLELGADDYVTKPFGLRELLARVRAILRRRELKGVTRSRDAKRGGFRFGHWQVERHARRLTMQDGSSVVLTNSEFSLLVAFLESPGRPLSREQLLTATRVHEDIFDRSIDVQVLRLRRKLETDASSPRVILTERGIGYVFALPVETF